MVAVEDPEERMALDNIEEFLNDHGKIVTYKFLSLTLSIHVTKSKHLLEEYLKEKNELEEHLEVVYFIGGIKHIGSEKVMKFTLVKKDSLKEIKEKFDTVTTCHIYSIQKSKLKNFDTLYSSDCDLVKQSLHDLHNYSETQCNFTRRDNVNPVIYQPTTTNTSLNGYEKIKPSPKVNNNPKTNEIKNQEKETQAALFFGSKTGKKEEETDIESSKKPLKKAAKPSGIAGAFAKSKPSKKKTEEKIEEGVGMDVDKPKDESPPNDKTSEKQERKTNKKRKVVMEGSDDEEDFENFLATTKKSKTESSKDNIQKSSKKSRIESDDEDEDEDVIAPTPEPMKKPKSKRRKKDSPQVPSLPKLEDKAEETKVENQPEEEAKGEKKSSSPETTVKRRKRRMVMKSKQFTDDEGFMVTRKVSEYESYSEESDNEEEKKVLKKEDKNRVSKELETKTKAASKNPKSQSSIGSFFKKLK